MNESEENICRVVKARLEGKNLMRLRILLKDGRQIETTHKNLPALSAYVSVHDNKWLELERSTIRWKEVISIENLDDKPE